MIAQSQQLLNHGGTARQDVRQDVKREELCLDRNTEIKSPSVKTPDTNIIDSISSEAELDTYVSTMPVRQEQKDDWQLAQALDGAEGQHSVFRPAGPPSFPPPEPSPDKRLNHIACHMDEETEKWGQGRGTQEGESGVGTGAGPGEVLSTRQVTTPRNSSLLLTRIHDSSDDEDVTALMQDVQNLNGMRWLRYQHSMSVQERLLPLPSPPPSVTVGGSHTGLRP